MEDKLGPPELVAGAHAGDCKEAFKDDEVEIARAEMRKVKEENSRLKMLLEKVENDYNALHERFVSIRRPVAPQTPTCINNEHVEEREEPDQVEVSLCLGRSSSPVAEPKKPAKERLSPLKKEGGLGLDLDFNPVDNIPGPEKSPLKDVKDDDDLSQTGVKRARVSVRTRCDTTTMNDGCQWRKYGQKISKGNPCPRAYYRCTVATSCPVRKQVQRCSQDTSVLITTYEGTHNHQLPFAATAMASTTSAAASITSAAASMLLSGSSSSSTSHPLLNHALNASDNSRSMPYYLPISSPTSFPTITLDLTSDNTSAATSSQFSNLFSSRLNASASLNFAAMPPAWGSGNFNYSSLQPVGRGVSPFVQMNYQAAAPVPSQQALTETLTKAITSDPSFRSAIAAAITTMVGGGAGAAQAGNEKLEGLNKKLKLDDQIPASKAGCASSFLNQPPFSTMGSLSFTKQQPQPPFSISMGAGSVTTSENADQTKQMLLD